MDVRPVRVHVLVFQQVPLRLFQTEQRSEM